ncbi:hypothetical protein GCM10025768_13130 [Microbacterium pseudoresistens]|uniref:Outer membrane protein OmpA-like peptidoglycan-associated protein n=1 Tax=Microbacterium pseudoresistens TaxID=640634 RepID=A0A7Y9JL56_9MICO|nr:hypothetical protein [Microbacterium pseudoresistens]NYD53332.1 outer membrane protein OmpA-like peptidoglycan-associated protein [Microbacterium pseudoresistens]
MSLSKRERIRRLVAWSSGGAVVLGIGLAAPTAAFAVPVPAEVAVTAAPAPADPTLVFEETFDDNVAETAISVADYARADGGVYSSTPSWLDLEACNGVVLQAADTVFDPGICNINPDARAHVQRLAQQLGVVNGAADPATNHAVTAYTDKDGASGDNVMLQGPAPSAFELTADRFYVAGVDVAEINCSASINSRLFPGFAVSGDSNFASDAIVACAGGTSDGDPNEPVFVGSFVSDGIQSPATGAAEFVLWNSEVAGSGNDFAYDNLRLYDATPTLHKSFAQEAVRDRSARHDAAHRREHERALREDRMGLQRHDAVGHDDRRDAERRDHLRRRRCDGRRGIRRAGGRRRLDRPRRRVVHHLDRRGARRGRRFHEHDHWRHRSGRRAVRADPCARALHEPYQDGRAGGPDRR